MRIVSVISTKGGVGKTTVTANLGGFLADAGLRVLMLDLDIQPTLSSYYKLNHHAPCGMYEFIAFNEQRLEQIISNTTIKNLDLVFSNDDKGQLNTLLLHAPDGRLRLKNLLSIFKPYYDVVLIDTQGARSVLLEMAIIASTELISPVTPEVLAAREFKRGTLQLLEDLLPYNYLGISLPTIQLLINRVPSVSRNARLIQQMLGDLFKSQSDILLLKTSIPAIEAYAKSSIQAQPVHRIEYRKPSGRQTVAAIDTIRSLACELFPAWNHQFQAVVGKYKEVDNAS